MGHVILPLLLWVTQLCLFDASEDTCVYLDYYDKNDDLVGTECRNNSVCNSSRVFNVSYIYTPPYHCEKTSYTRWQIHEILEICCGKCAKIHLTKNIFFRNITELTPHWLEESDFVYPILASASTREVHGFYYLPFWFVPEIVYVTEMRPPQLTGFIEEIFPVVIIGFLMSIVAGAIGWSLETWNNEEEFPKRFLIGWFEGIWWSFISMSTVGYGDRKTRSVFGRLFSIIWITIGITTYGIVVGLVYSKVMELNNSPPLNMMGDDVGSLLYRDYDASMVGNLGGKRVHNNKSSTSDFNDDVILLIHKLQNKNINGFVLDKYTLWYVHHILNDFLIQISNGNRNNTWGHLKSLNSTINFFFHNTIHTEMSFNGKSHLAYGALVKNKKDYIYLKNVVHERILREKTKIALKWNDERGQVRKEIEKNRLFSYKGPIFQKALSILLGIILVIFLTGFIYELKQSNGNLRKIFVKEHLLEELNL